MLAAVDLSHRFKIEIDASYVGASQSIIEKEALALLLALKQFKAFLMSRPLPVVVYTNHNSLVFLLHMYNMSCFLLPCPGCE